MPRRGRAVVPSSPHPVIQRGHNKQVVFAEPGDFQYYLATLAECKEEYGVKVYAFCRMTNHVHPIVQPGEVMAGLGQLLQRLAGRQTRSVNRQERRSETLWESRYKSSSRVRYAYLTTHTVRTAHPTTVNRKLQLSIGNLCYLLSTSRSRSIRKLRGCMETFVARMQADRPESGVFPDSAALHPGYNLLESEA
jgi:REP element-mobilizing transposase RayT